MIGSQFAAIVAGKEARRGRPARPVFRQTAARATLLCVSRPAPAGAARVLVTGRQATHTEAMRHHPTEPDFAAEPAAPVRPCDHPGCDAGGDFRAPRSRLELNLYYWFCLEHVRAYNTAWNYYAGMSEVEIEAEIRRDTVWQRPSWKLGERHGPGPRTAGERVHDPFGFHFGAGADRRHNGHNRARDGAARAASAREQALAVFDIEPPFTPIRLKARYKVLVKEHHPDAHGGDKASEEKLKIINQAYATLKASYFN